MAFRFVHTADIHLDSPLKSLALRDPQLADLIGTASRSCFKAIIDLCIDEQVDALLIAGDLYDGEQTSMKTARFLVEQIRRLDQAGIRTFIIRGNHDALSKITQELVFPDSVKVFDARAEAFELSRSASDVPIVVHGLSFRHSQAPDSLVGKYKPAIDGAVNIGLMHTSLGGTEGHDVYAPCSVKDLAETGFNYWALGHIHKRSVDLGRTTIVMPGIPQGRDINEAGRKSVTLVTINDDLSIGLEEKHTSIAEFARVPVSVHGLSDWRDAVQAISKSLTAARDESLSTHLVVRLQISGATPLAWRMRRDAELLKAEAADFGARIGNCWIDKVENAASAEIGTIPTADPLLELRALISEKIGPSAGFQQSLADMVDELTGQLPNELKSLFGNTEEAQIRLLQSLAAEGAEDVLARLSPSTLEGQ